MKWYRDNRIIGSVLVMVALLTAFSAYKIIKSIGPAMGDEVKKENGKYIIK